MKKLFKYWCRYGHSIADCREKQQDNHNKPQKFREPNKSFYQNMKKDENLANKNIHITKNWENHFLIIILPPENKHPADNTIAEDVQLKEIHEVSHKIDIVDQTVRTIIIETTFQDQTQTEVFIQIITGIVQTQTPEIDIIQTTVLAISHIVGTETIQTTGTDNIKITDHEAIQTKIKP